MRYLLVFIFLCLMRPSVQGQGLPVTEPETVGMSAEALSRIDEALRHTVDTEKTAGIVTLIAREGKVVYHKSVGLMDREAGKPMPEDAIFRIASMTKPITVVAALMLYEDGKLHLDDPVATYLPAFEEMDVYAGTDQGTVQYQPLERPITIRDLLQYTSGLASFGFEKSPVDPQYEKALQGASSLADLTQRLATVPLLQQPGSGWKYSYDTNIIARIVEVVSGQDYRTYLKTQILGPLAMKDTDYYVTDENRDRLAALYTRTEQGLDRVTSSSAARPEQPHQRFLGSTGLVSTATDYARFLQMLLNGGTLDGVRLLREETVALMTQNHLPDAMQPIQVDTFPFPGQGFGFGVGVVTDDEDFGLPGTEGLYRWAGAAHTFFWVHPEEELIGVIMTQLVPVPSLMLDGVVQPLVYQALLDRRSSGTQ